jgi:RNA polymerase sigma factor (TIGR02999 family)
MSVPGQGEVTRLLKQWRQGSRTAEARLFALVLPDLRRLARRYMRRERQGHTLAPTALLNETYLRLTGAKHQDWQDRRHFFAVAARAMRRYLIDYARGRPKAQFVSMTGSDWLPAAETPRMETALAVDRLLTELEHEHPDRCAVVEFKFFLGFTDQETADALGIPLRTVQRRWQEGREWLYERLRSES